METFPYHSLRWRLLARRAKQRDGSRCTVARLLGGDCSPVLHAHHVRPVADYPDEAFDLGNVATACDSHHPVWEALRRRIVGELDRPDPGPARCRHEHRTAAARAECERRMARRDRRSAVTA